MKKQFLIIFKTMFITGLAILMMYPVRAQKGIQGITQDQLRQINEIVKPLKDLIDKQLNEDKTGNYKAYLEDLKKLNSLENAKDRSALSNKILEKYSDFFKSIWGEARVDERAYQARIRKVFPDATGNLIQFESFLNFSINYSLFTGTTVRSPEAPAPNKCLDVCAIAAGEITGTAGLISGGGGAYGNCYLRTNSWGAAVAKSELYGYLRNNITIPGTLPSDNRKLHVKKTYQLRQEATSFAAIGFGYSETWGRTYQSSEYLLAMSPVVYGITKISFKSMTEDYLLQKKDVAKSIFRTYAGTFAFVFSANWCYTDCGSISWSICEE